MGAWVTIRVYDDFHGHVVDGARLRHEGIAFRLQQEIWGRRRGIMLFQVSKADVTRACQALSIPEPEPYSYSPLSGLGLWLHGLAQRAGLVSFDRRPKWIRWVEWITLVASVVTIILLL